MAGRPRNTQAPGDYTAREKARLAKEHAKEIEESQIAKGIQTQAEIDAEANGIWDPVTQTVIEDESGIDTGYVYIEEDEPLDPAAPQVRPIDAFQDLRPTEVPQAEDTRELNPFEVPEDPKSNLVFVEEREVKFKVNSDIEEMTFGAQNPIMNFYVGKNYKGPKALYDHLESKGLIYH
jgi:hypothetical protein